MTGREFVPAAAPATWSAARAIGGDVTALSGVFWRLSKDGLYRAWRGRQRRSGREKDHDDLVVMALAAGVVAFVALATAVGGVAAVGAAGASYTAGHAIRRRRHAKAAAGAGGPVRVSSHTKKVAGRTFRVDHHRRSKEST